MPTVDASISGWDIQKDKMQLWLLPSFALRSGSEQHKRKAASAHRPDAHVCSPSWAGASPRPSVWEPHPTWHPCLFLEATKKGVQLPDRFNCFQVKRKYYEKLSGMTDSSKNKTGLVKAGRGHRNLDANLFRCKCFFTRSYLTLTRGKNWLTGQKKHKMWCERGRWWDQLSTG